MRLHRLGTWFLLAAMVACAGSAEAASARVLRIGYQKYGTLVLEKPAARWRNGLRLWA